MDLAQYAELFLAEAKEHLAAVTELLLAWEREPASREPIGGIFRAVHTIKGMAATMGYAGVADLSHRLENLLDGLRRTGRSPDEATLELLFRSADALEALTGAAVAGREAALDAGLTAQLDQAAAAFAPAAARVAATLARVPAGEPGVGAAAGAGLIAGRNAALTVLFSGFVGFTGISARPAPAGQGEGEAAHAARAAGHEPGLARLHVRPQHHDLPRGEGRHAQRHGALRPHAARQGAHERLVGTHVLGVGAIAARPEQHRQHAVPGPEAPHVGAHGIHPARHVASQLHRHRKCRAAVDAAMVAGCLAVELMHLAGASFVIGGSGGGGGGSCARVGGGASAAGCRGTSGTECLPRATGADPVWGRPPPPSAASAEAVP